jgi:RNA polymerase sigma factor (sigma-70 family)
MPRENGSTRLSGRGTTAGQADPARLLLDCRLRDLAIRIQSEIDGESVGRAANDFFSYLVSDALDLRRFFRGRLRGLGVTRNLDLETEDGLQSFAVTVLRALQRRGYDPSRSDWILPWLFQIAANVASDSARRILALERSQLPGGEAIAETVADCRAEAAFGRAVFYSELRHATRLLSPQERSILVASLAGAADAEIAAAIAVEVATVYSQKSRALAKVRASLAETSH